MIEAHQIFAMAFRVRDYIFPTPVMHSDWLSHIVGASVYLKLENLQKSGSFKARGVLAQFMKLETPPEHITSASCGNYGLALAYFAKVYQSKLTLIMPRSTPPFLVHQVELLGATVVLHGETLLEAYQFSKQFGKLNLFFQPWDDDTLLLGYGSVAVELLYHQPDLDTLFVPTGSLAKAISIYAPSINPLIDIQKIELKTKDLKMQNKMDLNKKFILKHKMIIDQTSLELIDALLSCSYLGKKIGVVLTGSNWNLL